MRDLSAAIISSAASQLTTDEPFVITRVIDGVRYTLTRTPEQPPDAEETQQCAHLSAREFEIARMVARGYPNKTIAAVLNISNWTVDTYLRRIFTKLSVRSRSAMVAALTRAGILDEHNATPDWSEAWHAATTERDRADNHTLTGNRPPTRNNLPAAAARAKGTAAG